jgi:hypothetical protein
MFLLHKQEEGFPFVQQEEGPLLVLGLSQFLYRKKRMYLLHKQEQGVPVPFVQQ